jgi:DNA-directed RNA polymerase specialized sigma24 family protein
MDSHPTVFRAFDLTPDVLTAQGRALRGLARALIGESDADDVVQETWLACLKHPGALPERCSAWLAAVAKNIAYRRKRGEGRRRARERRAVACPRA